MSTTLSRVVTAKDIKVIVSGRTIGSITELSLNGNSGLADTSVLGKQYKQSVRTKKEFSGTFTMLISDMEAFGWAFGDYEVDPAQVETINMAYNGQSVDILHIQGLKDASVSVASGEKVAQKFRAAGKTLSLVKLYNNGSGDSSVTVSVEADNSGVPSGTALASATVDFSGSTGWLTADLSAATLTKGNWYWIVVSVPTTTTTLSRSSTNIYEDWGYMIYSTSWGTLNSEDLAFYIKTTDNETIIQVELTDGINTHIIKGDIGIGNISTTVSQDEPIKAEVNFTAQELIFSG